MTATYTLEQQVVVSNDLQQLPMDRITPDPGQPRKWFYPEALGWLANSIRKEGLLQPIAVRSHGSGYIIIAGERRWRAVRSLGWTTIPALVVSASEQKAAELQLLENIAREDLNPVEEARAYKAFLERGYTEERLAVTVGTTVSWIKWRVQMLNAQPAVLQLVEIGKMTWWMAYELSRLTPNGQMEALRVITSQQLNTDEVTALCGVIYARENQMDMMPETLVSKEQRKAVEAFDAMFSGVAGLLGRLLKIEEDHPGTLVEALGPNMPVVQTKVTESIRSLGRLRRLLQAGRARKLVESR